MSSTYKREKGAGDFTLLTYLQLLHIQLHLKVLLFFTMPGNVLRVEQLKSHRTR